MEDHQCQICERALKWIVSARYPLNSLVLLDAARQDADLPITELQNDLTEEIMLECCHNLLVVDPVRHVWMPSHLSVIEYFESNVWLDSEAELLTAAVCLKVLQDEGSVRHFSGLLQVREDSRLDDMDGGNVSVVISPDDHLYKYTAINWVYQIKKVSPFYCETGAPTLSLLLEQFLLSPSRSTTAYDLWVDFVRNIPLDIHQWPLYPLPLVRWKYETDWPYWLRQGASAFVVVGLGNHCPVQHWWQSKSYWTLGKDDMLLLLVRAVLSQDLSTCKKLIQFGADVNHILVPSTHHQVPGTALIVAASTGCKDIVDLLVKAGANVNMYVLSNMDNWLHPCHSQHKGPSTTPSETKCRYVRTLVSALSTAAGRRHFHVVEYLLQQGAQVDFFGSCGCWNSAIFAAYALYHYVDTAADWATLKPLKPNVLRMLISPRPTLSENLPLTFALARAAYLGKIEACVLLLQAGADVNLCLGRRDTAATKQGLSCQTVLIASFSDYTPSD